MLAPSIARAHGRSVSYSAVRLDGDGATVRLRLTRLDLDALAHAVGPRVEPWLVAHLQLRTAAGPCAPEAGSFRPLEAPPGEARFEWRLRCPPAAPAAITVDALFEIVPGHLHFTRVRAPGLDERELLLTADAPTAALDRAAAPGAARRLARYLLLGVRHIATGWDHLAFLFALVLLAGRFRDLALAATGFTAGHSATLALAALGIARPDAQQVEALVALSIVLLAIENIWILDGRRGDALPAATVIALALLAACAALLGVPRHAGVLALAGLALLTACHLGLLARAGAEGSLALHRAAVAALFGLIHGFAFASVLREAELPRAALAGALLGFNLGVEAGQLVVLAAAVGLARLALRVATRLTGDRFPRRLLLEAGSAAAAALGTYWFITRAS